MADVIQSILIHSGHTIRLALGCARQGEITDVRLAQRNGPRDGFSYEFSAASEACPPGYWPNTDAYADQRVLDPDLRDIYRIGDPREVASGQGQFLVDGKPATKVEGWKYKNRDHGGSQTNMARKIYLEVVDHGPVDRDVVKELLLALTVETKSD